MIWSHNDLWMLTADHSGFVKYWQSNMNNVKMYQAHRDPVRGLRWDMLRTDAASVFRQSDGVSATTLDIQACFMVSRWLASINCVTVWFCTCTGSSGMAVALITVLMIMLVINRWMPSCTFQLLVTDGCLQLLTYVAARQFLFCLCHAVIESCVQ